MEVNDSTRPPGQAHRLKVTNPGRCLEASARLLLRPRRILLRRTSHQLFEVIDEMRLIEVA
jgi:hypothetical protein